MLVFKALSALLSYPTEPMREALPEIERVIAASPLVPAAQRDALSRLIKEIGAGDLMSAEERYVDLFDRGRALSLNLFEHLHGDSRDRGQAMVELKRLYQAAGFELATRELPDYLPVLLEYLSRRDLAEARELLADCAAILAAICRSLLARRSPYAAVLQALLVIAGERPIEAEKIPPIPERPEALDRDWAEEPAFANEARAPTEH
ncbi:MAG TPA: nitrate reductase molybdenum cofactor assembly chaperone [Xanthobacteraceae bacterium]|nr:nitrate reductase molybdenum cofactor assembly chaperone [Xanthobacteraceae bacterium]